MKYRKKPVVIEAFQFDGSNVDDVLSFTRHTAYHQDGQLYIPTLEGDMKASTGDFIIEGVNGEFYPCKPDIFEKTYEKVKEL